MSFGVYAPKEQEELKCTAKHKIVPKWTYSKAHIKIFLKRTHQSK